MMKRSLVVSLIGRPNVGKSSIFNRLVKKRDRAITLDKAGVTRDRNYAITSLDEIAGADSVDVIVVDTGGFYPQQSRVQGKIQSCKEKEEEQFNSFFNIMVDHAHTAIEESDLVLMIVDAREGMLPFDESIFNYIRSQKKMVWPIVNKYDSDGQMGDEAEFYTLGCNPDDMFLTSAAHGLGLNDLKKRIQEEALSFRGDNAPVLQKGVTPRESVVAKLAIVGAPNAGKSTLLNQLVGSSRALVSDIAGTTVDPVDGHFDIYFGKDAVQLEGERSSDDGVDFESDYEAFRKNNPVVYSKMMEDYLREDKIDEDDIQDFLGENSVTLSCDVSEEEDVKECSDSFWRTVHLVDTAGIRRKKSVDSGIESMSVFQALKAISEADIVLFTVDATKGISHQDRRLIDVAIEKGKSIIICLNKFDLISPELRDNRERKEWMQDMQDKVPWLSFCDLVPISAKYGKHIKNLKSVIKKTILVRNKKIRSGELNKTIHSLVERHSIMPSKSRGVRLKIRYASMIKSSPPTFILFTNKSKGIADGYKRYLQNGIRAEFNLANTPVHLIFRSGADLEKRKSRV